MENKYKNRTFEEQLNKATESFTEWYKISIENLKSDEKLKRLFEDCRNIIAEYKDKLQKTD